MTYYNGRWHLYSEAERRAYGETQRQKQRDKWHAAWLSKTGLKDRLWTDKAIATFLGQPKKAGPVKAWRRQDVTGAESTAAFKDWMQGRCRSLVKRGVLEEEILNVKLTTPQRELLASIAAGASIRRVEEKPERFKWYRRNKSCTRVARQLESLGLINYWSQTRLSGEMRITAEGLCVLAFS